MGLPLKIIKRTFGTPDWQLAREATPFPARLQLRRAPVRLCDEAKPGQILISPRVLTKVENAVTVEPVGEFELKGIRRPLAAYNVVRAVA